jgi:hypothetical protein
MGGKIDIVHMYYLSGKLRHDLPSMVTFGYGKKPTPNQLWAADNGCYARPDRYDNVSYITWLRKFAIEGLHESCLFATAPDVMGDAQQTIYRSLPMLAAIRDEGYPAALVAQDGLENLKIPWNELDCLFIGGTTEWKLSEHAYNLIGDAKSRGKWVHMGRVNSWIRFRSAAAAGCDSVDGTYLRFDPSETRNPNNPIAGWRDRVLTSPGIWTVNQGQSVRKGTR